MKLELNQSIGLRHKIEEILDALLELIMQFKDYVVYKHITYIEVAIFSLAFGRAVWYVAYGVQSTTFDYFFSEAQWTACFCVVSLVHLFGLFARSCCLRILAFYGYSLAWGVLLLLALYSRTQAPAAPTYIVYFVFSFILIVRLSRKKGVDGEC